LTLLTLILRLPYFANRRNEAKEEKTIYLQKQYFPCNLHFAKQNVDLPRSLDIVLRQPKVLSQKGLRALNIARSGGWKSKFYLTSINLQTI
jgi:hypothetical protein